jgi:O-antigen/teichoic acid export membrane protein
MLSTIFEIGSRIIVTYMLLMYTSDIWVLYGVYFLSIVSALTFFVSDMRTMLDSRGEWNFSVDEARDMRRQVLPMVLMSCFLISIGSIELVLARRILGNEDLGYFSALIMLSKLVLAWLSIWISVGMAYFADMSKHRMLLALIYGGFVASVMISIAVFVVAGEWMVTLLFPPNYSVIIPYVLPMVAIACIISVTSLLIQHAVIGGQKMAWYLSIIIPISVIITLVFSDHTLSAVVYATLWWYSAGAGMWLSLFLLSLLIERGVKK